MEAAGGATFERTDPFTGAPVTVAAAAGREDARRAVEAARDGVPGVVRHARRASGASCSAAAADLLMERAPDDRRRR